MWLNCCNRIINLKGMKSYFLWMRQESGFLRWNLYLVKPVEMTTKDWFSVPPAAGLTSPLWKKDLGCTSQCPPQHLIQTLFISPLPYFQPLEWRASCWKAFQYFMHHRGIGNTLRVEEETVLHEMKEEDDVTQPKWNEPGKDLTNPKLSSQVEIFFFDDNFFLLISGSKNWF